MPVLEDQAAFAFDRPRRLCASGCGLAAGVTPPVAACIAGRARVVASPAGVGKASAAGVAESQNPSSADFTWLSGEKYPSCHVSSLARKCHAVSLLFDNQYRHE